LGSAALDLERGTSQVFDGSVIVDDDRHDWIDPRLLDRFEINLGRCFALDRKTPEEMRMVVMLLDYLDLLKAR
jgi:hypothetical protein